MELVIPTLFNLRSYRSAHRRVVVLLDGQTGLDGGEIVRCLRPWASWITIDGIVTVGAALPAGLMESMRDRGAGIAVLLSTSAPLAAHVRSECARWGMAYVDATLPPIGSRELGLLQEVLHHDFEIGGFNEWTGKDPQYSAAVLRSLSIAQCRRAFPGYAAPHLERLWQQHDGRPLATLDVGCGALSRLRWGSLNGFLTVTGVDPLLDMYAILRERHGLSGLPHIGCARDLCIGAEDLKNHIVPGSYDFVYSSNALDHTVDPSAVIESVAMALRPGGLFALDVFTREGSRENWWQLHQFDMYVNDRDELMCEGRDSQPVPLFSDDCGLVVREVSTATESVTAVVAERVAVSRPASMPAA